MAVNPTGAGTKAFLAENANQPVVMLNLLHFADGGERGYETYLAHFVAEEGQARDAVLLVSHPSRRAFSDMVRNTDYQAGTHLRTEALVEAVLQPTAARQPSRGAG